MFHGMGGKGGYGGRGYGRPQPVAAPVSVTLAELYTGADKVLDLDELAEEELKKMGVSGKLDVQIKPGMRKGSRIPFPGKGIQLPGMPEEARGDLIAVVDLEDHPTFKVDGDDLRATMTVTLAEALTGFTKEFEHIDGKKLLITSDSVVAPQSVHKVEKKGMPIADKATGEVVGSGDLLLTFNVEFPRILEDDQIEKIKPLLPTRKMEPQYDTSADLPVYDFTDYNPEEWHEKQVREEDESDDDEGGPRVACAHQ